MNKFCLLFIIGLSILIKAQPDGNGAQEFKSILFSNLHIVPSDTSNSVYFSFKVPYNRLVFEKTGDKYRAEYNISIEVFDSSDNFVVRTSSKKGIETANFNETDSKVLFSEGLCEFEAGKGDYYILPVFTDIKSGREIKLPPQKVNISKYLESDIFAPVIMNSVSLECGEAAISSLANLNGSIPFAEEAYNMLVPVADTTVNSIDIVIVKEKDTLFSETITKSFISGLTVEECSNKVVLKKSGEGKQTKNFLVKDFNHKLYPGNIVIKVSKTADPKSEETFQKSVVWYNMPLSLNNPEFAIRILKNIEADSVISRLLNEDSDFYLNVLLDYWKKYDPTPGTSFNQLMNEFYDRVDYAMMNFSSIDGKSGAETDRGKVLIQLGKPNKVERTSDEYGKVVETWVYEKPQRKFIFIDRKGTGNFSLLKG